MSTKSLWARFMRAKFCKNGVWSRTKTDSPLWTSMLDQLPVLNQSVRWIIGVGNVSFWDTNWVGEKIIGPQPTDVSLTVKDALPIRNDIRQWIPSQLQRHIEGVELCSLRDKMVFAPFEIGNFSAKLFAAQIRKTGTRRI